MTPGGWLVECGDSRLDRCTQLLAHRIRGGVLVVRIGVVHRGGRDIGHRQVPDFADLETGGLRAGPWSARQRPLSRRCCTRVPRPGSGRAWRSSRTAVPVVEVTLDPGDAESSSEFPEEPRACHPSSRKMTPRNSSTITMARRGSPEESGTRSFIEPTVARKEPRTCKGAYKTNGRQVTSKPRRRAARAFWRLARNRRSRFTSMGSAASASGRSTSALSTW